MTRGRLQLTRLRQFRRRPDMVQALGSNMLISTNILLLLLGPEWVHRYSQSQAGVGGDASLTRVDTLAVAFLAEATFNLQSVPGFSSWIEELRKANLAGAVAEAEAAMMLAVQGHSFEFVARSGLRRQDYDLRIALGSRVVSCEIKSRTDGTKIDVEGLRSVVADACKQLPSDVPCLVWIKLDSKWATHPLRDVLLRVALFGSRGSGSFARKPKVVAVMFHWHEHDVFLAQYTRMQTRVVCYLNRTSPYWFEGLSTLDGVNFCYPSTWTRVVDLAEEFDQLTERLGDPERGATLWSSDVVLLLLEPISTRAGFWSVSAMSRKGDELHPNELSEINPLELEHGGGCVLLRALPSLVERAARTLAGAASAGTPTQDPRS